MKTVVKKFGGATLATPEQIRQVAVNLSECHKRGENIIAVVSAMGQTTNDLIKLAHQVSSKPKRRELDMLLTTGERISMSLLSMALNELDCPAISFTGSQAGILTDDSHLNAFITDINPVRVYDALKDKKVVIIAGFQGVSPKTKEITTLGRGGTDTTAVAMAAALNASFCEILKEVPGVFTADPNLIPFAQPIQELSYKQILEMTFWGAKVLHYRSIELAIQRNVPLYIGKAIDHSIKTKSSTENQSSSGTWIRSEETMNTNQHKSHLENSYESVQILSINSHSEVLEMCWDQYSLSDGLQKLKLELLEKEISFPQLLSTELEMNQSSHLQTSLFLTGPSETINAIKNGVSKFSKMTSIWSTVSATCTGASTPDIASQILTLLESHQIIPSRLWMSGMSCTVLLKQDQRIKAIELLHTLINIKLNR